MICPKCKNEIQIGTYCTHCNSDMKINIKIQSVSNQYYNEGLARAKVRNLTGAIDSLKNSLKLNKYNSEARNLLGLVYFEMGETVLALSQWLISKHLNSEDNRMADYYINAAQSNQNKLQSISETIKKYNQALQYVNQGSEDLAIIQLRKSINLNPNYIKAYLLLSLMYVHEKEVDKAVKSLQKVLEIDKNNTQALAYLSELGKSTDKPIMTRNAVKVSSERQIFKSELPEVSMNSGKEYDKLSKSAYGMQFLNVVIGIVIGMCVIWFLIVPTKTNALITENNRLKSQMDGKTSTKDTTIVALESEKEEMTKQLTELQKELDEYKENGTMAEFLDAVQLYIDKKEVEAGKKILKINKNNLQVNSAKTIYNTIYTKTSAKVYYDLYNDGISAYNKKKYEDVIKNLEAAIKIKQNDVQAYYYLARAYHINNDKDNALKYYEKVINDFKGTNSAKAAKVYYNQLLK